MIWLNLKITPCTSDSCTTSKYCEIPQSYSSYSSPNPYESITTTHRNCFTCDPNAYPVTHLTDLNNPGNTTCWLSKHVIENNRINNVTIHIPLSKSYHIHYISLQFCTSRPKNMVILKSQDHGRTYQPYQYYSDACRSTFGVKPTHFVDSGFEKQVLCSEAYSSLYPTSGTRIAFSTIEGRPSSHNLKSSKTLQDWISATDIKIVFLEPNVHPEDRALFNLLTSDFLGEISRNKNLRSITNRQIEINRQEYEHQDFFENLVKGSYYYGVSDLSIGGRCNCNGHASKCLIENGTPVCSCRHNTAGPDCGQCSKFHHDRPWAPASDVDANECQRK